MNDIEAIRLRAGRVTITRDLNKEQSTITYIYKWPETPIVGISHELLREAFDIRFLGNSQLLLGPWLCDIVSADGEAIYVQRAAE